MTLLPSRAICGSVTERICQKVSEFNPGLAANSAAELKRSKRSVRMAVQYTTGGLLQTLVGRVQTPFPETSSPPKETTDPQGQRPTTSFFRPDSRQLIGRTVSFTMASRGD